MDSKSTTSHKIQKVKTVRCLKGWQRRLINKETNTNNEFIWSHGVMFAVSSYAIVASIAMSRDNRCVHEWSISRIILRVCLHNYAGKPKVSVA